MPRPRPGLHQLRFVRESSAPLLRFIPDVTAADIAGIWGATADRRPVGIGAAFAPNRANAVDDAPARMSWLPTHLAWGRNPAE